MIRVLGLEDCGAELFGASLSLSLFLSLSLSLSLSLDTRSLSGTSSDTVF